MEAGGEDAQQAACGPDPQIWDNNIVPNGVNGRALSPPLFPNIRVLDDILVGNNTMITGWRASSIEDNTWIRGPVMEATLRANNPGGGPQPGAGGIVAVRQGNFTSTATGAIYFGRQEFVYCQQLLPPVQLPAGQFWIGLRQPGGAGTGTNYWLTSDGGPDGAGTSTAYFSLDAGVTFMPSTSEWHLAFDCYGQTEQPVGACCLPGQCVDGMTPEECNNQGGQFQGVGSQCPDVECGHAGPWDEPFDQYPPGQSLHGVNGWKGWDDNPAATGFVTDQFANSPPNSLQVAGDTDLVHPFIGFTSGQCSMRGAVFVPPTHSGGDTYFLMLNTYRDRGPYNWSCQVHFNNDLGLVQSDGLSGIDGELPLVTGRWVPIEVIIDLDADSQTFLYDGQVLYTKSWTDGVSGDGALNIATIDLYANGTSAVYYDDLSLCIPEEPLIGACCLGGKCLDGMEAPICAKQGGEFQGVGTTCRDVVCEPPPTPVAIYADPRESSIYGIDPVGTGLGRSPILTHAGQVMDFPYNGALTVSGVGQTIAENRQPVGETVAGPRQPETRDREDTPPPEKKGCEPPEMTPNADIGISLGNIVPSKRGGNAPNGEELINAIDVGLGLGWNFAYSVLIRDDALGHYHMLTRDSDFVRFTPDGQGGWNASAGAPFTLEISGSTATATHVSGTVYEYEEMSPAVPLPGVPMLLQSITDRNGNTSTYTYDSGKLITMTDAAGRSLQLNHHGDGHIESITDPIGRRVSFEYDGNLLTAIVLPDNNRIEYTYDALGRMTSKTVPNGGTYTVEYTDTMRQLRDANDQPVVTVTNAGGFELDMDRADATGELSYTPSTSVATDAKGQIKRYTYNERGQITQGDYPDGSTTQWGYHAGSRRVSSQEDCAGNTWTYEYDVMGNLTRSVDPLGNEKRAEYAPGTDRVTRRIEPDGDEWRYLYDGQGNLTTIIDPIVEQPTDKVYQFAYDGAGHRTSITDPNGNVIRYVYVDGLPVRKIADFGDLNLTTTYEYDLMGRLTRVIDSEGVVTERQHDFLNRLVRSVVDPGGQGHLNLETRTVFDEHGNIVATVNEAGIRTEYVYDTHDRLITATQAVGDLDYVTRFEYDANGNRTRYIAPTGSATNFEYDERDHLIARKDALGNFSGFAYDCMGNVIRSTDAAGREVSYAYDAINRKIREIRDPGGLALTTQWEYAQGGCGCGTPGGDLIHKITNPDGKVAYLYYDALDRLVTRVMKFGDTDDNGGDADDAVTHVEYDFVGNVTRVLVEEDTGPEHVDRVAVFAYDGANRQIVSTIDPGGADVVTRFEYDARGRVLRQVQPEGATVSFTYDAAGRGLTITDDIGQAITQTFLPTGLLETVRDANGNGLNYEYDALGRTTRLVDGLGNGTTYEYDAVGNIARTTDRLGNQRSYAYDAAGRLTHVVTPLTAPDPTTQFTYDATNLQLSQVDANGNTTRYTYDAVGRLTRETNADGFDRRFTYDGRGHTVQTVTPNGDTVDYTYDDLGRLTDRAFTVGPQSPSAPTADHTFTWDRTATLKSTTNGQSTTTFTYDGAGRLVRSDQDGRETAYAYAFGGNGSTETITYPSGYELTMTRDSRKRLTALGDGNGNITQVDFDGANRVQQIHMANGVDTALVLNANAWVARLTHTNPGGDFVDLEYGRDAEGNPTYVRQHHDLENSMLYAYDAANRLVDFQRGRLSNDNQSIEQPGTLPGALQTQQWTDLDPLGNWKEIRLTRDDETRTETRGVGPANVYTNVDERAKVYDRNGNLILASVGGDGDGDLDVDLDDLQLFGRCIDGPCEGGNCGPYAEPECRAVDFDLDLDVDLEDWWRFQERFSGAGETACGVVRYTYDVLNRLVEVKNIGCGGHIVGYSYDVLGRRVSRTESGATTHFVYDNHGRVIEERDTAGDLAARYTFGSWIDDVVTMERGGERYFYHKDAGGSVVALTDSDGDVTERYHYSPYGETLITAPDGSPRDGSAVGNAFRFTSRWQDETTGLYDYRSRVYDPKLGRFLSRDMLGFADGDNLYQYVQSRPTVLGDPLGLSGTGKTCVALNYSPVSISSEGKIGPVSWSVSFEVKIGGEVCAICCPEGTPKACQWVTDIKLEVEISVSASASGSSYGGSVGPFSFWAGIKVTASLSGSASGTLETDRCNGIELQGKICLKASGSLSISGGAGIEIETWWDTYKIGANITGTGTIDVEKCLNCCAGGCTWEPGTLTVSASIDINVDAWVVSGTWNIWSGSKSFTI
jgi:RHS repeat-associated protein